LAEYSRSLTADEAKPVAQSQLKEGAAGPHQALAGRRGGVVVGLQQALRIGIDVLAPQGVDLLARQVRDLRDLIKFANWDAHKRW